MSHFDNLLKIEVRQMPPGVVVRLAGSAGMADAEALRSALSGLVAEGYPTIALDLSDLEFISSAGLSAVISAHLQTRHHGGRIRLVNPNPSVRHVLETTRLTQLFEIHSSVDEAIDERSGEGN